MNNRDGFEKWLNKKFGASNGTKSSYLKAIDLLSKQLDKKIYEEFDEKSLEVLYQDLKQNQRNKFGKFYAPDSPSYGLKGFYSASIKNYLIYLRS